MGILKRGRISNGVVSTTGNIVREVNAAKNPAGVKYGKGFCRDYKYRRDSYRICNSHRNS